MEVLCHAFHNVIATMQRSVFYDHTSEFVICNTDKDASEEKVDGRRILELLVIPIPFRYHHQDPTKFTAKIKSCKDGIQLQKSGCMGRSPWIFQQYRQAAITYQHHTSRCTRELFIAPKLDIQWLG